MSAISSVSSGSQSVLLQQLQQSGGTGSFSRADFQKQRQADFASALQSAGVDPSKVGDIQQQVDAAVQSVRQNAAPGTDQRSAIKDAVDSVLQKNGVDPTKFKAAIEAEHAQHAGHAHRGGKAKGKADGDSDDGSSASVAASTDSSSASGTSSIQSQKLADLLKALSDGANQQNPFADAPAGSLVDVSA